MHQGTEAAEIVRAAANSHADAVVMAASTRGAGVAEVVARAVWCRLFLVGPHEEAPPPVMPRTTAAARQAGATFRV